MITLGLVFLVLWLNRGDLRMLLLSAVVSVGILVKVPPDYFYLCCIIGETLILLAAYSLSTKASKTIIIIALHLMIAHLLGFYFQGYLSTSPYQYTVKFLEYSELAACALFSDTMYNKFKKGVLCPS